jgi:acyl-CoA dehydrogenase
LAGESDHIVAEVAARILADLADPQTVNHTTDGGWKAPLWQALGEAGLPLAWVPEHLGGSGATLAEGFAVIAAAGRFALAAPLTETLIAGWLMARAGLKAPADAKTVAMTIAPARPYDAIQFSGGALNGRALAVPFAADVQHSVVLAAREKQMQVALVDAKACRIEQGRTPAGDASNTVILERVMPLASAPVDVGGNELMVFGAVVRSVQTAGALEAILAMSVAYANERVAFERPIGKFQAVQQNLARLAGETAAALAVSGSAADVLAHGEVSSDNVFFEAAAAKIRCAEAATEGAAIAHQVFGAIGFTREHVLHRFTTRMLAWRDDFGNESWWAAELGRHVARRGADKFWPMVAAQ